MRSLSFFYRLGALTGVLALSACQVAPVSTLPESSLRLLDSQAIELPKDCRATGSVVVDFTVLESGQTDDIRPGDAPDCVQQALTAWVASFRYAPIGQRSPATVEWLLVEASRGS
jgi:hypothetical protein